MNDRPPFDPPFHAISAEFANAMLEIERSSEAAPVGVNKVSPKKDGRGPGPVAITKGGVIFLVVPFAEKDDAKGLGARWDAVARKWYVPLGKDIEAFKRWVPKE